MTTGTGASTRVEAVAAAERLLAAWGEVQTLMTRMPGLIDRRFGIPPHRLHVLDAIQRGAARIQDIAEASWTSVSAASRTVDGLVRDGWLDRSPDPDDRRATRVTITATGAGHLAEVQAWGEALTAELVADLGIERAERMATDLDAFAAQVSARLDREDAR